MSDKLRLWVCRDDGGMFRIGLHDQEPYKSESGRFVLLSSCQIFRPPGQNELFGITLEPGEGPVELEVTVKGNDDVHSMPPAG